MKIYINNIFFENQKNSVRSKSILIIPPRLKTRLKQKLMTIHFTVVRWWGFLLFTFFVTSSSFSQITIDQFIGVNTRGQDPLNRLQAVGHAREFHPWVFNEGFPTSAAASPAYPNNLYRWNPNYIDYIRFDDFYNEINGNGLTISPVAVRGIPQVVNPFLNENDPNRDVVLAQKPIMGGADPLLPSSYIAHAAYLYQYAARYGNTVFSVNRQNNLVATRLAANELPITGLGFIDYLENWNEQDQNGIFLAEEYAAMLSADYDGHGMTLGLIADPDNPNQMIATVGIKNADPSMKVVMGGLENADLNYIRRIVNWSIANRPANSPLPFDVINIHKYLGNHPDFNLSTAGVSPEEGGLKPFLSEFVTYRDSLMPNVELWLSEFGYDTNNNSKISVPTISNFTQYQVQGQWIVRSYLETMAAGFDRAMVFDLRDVCTGAFCPTFESAGLLETQFNNFKPKNAWYYVYTMKNVLTDLVFDADLSACNDLSCPRVYRFIDPNNANKRVYAVWSPTSNGTTVNFNLDLEGANAATLVALGAPSINGIVSTLSGTNPNINVSESPVFVVVGDNFTAGVGCTSNLSVSDPTCGSAKVNWDAPNGVEKFQLFFMTGNQTPAEFSLNTATLVADNIPANLLSYTVADLPINTNITFFLIPEGVAVDATNSNTPPICFVQSSTLPIGNSCAIPLNTNMIFDPSISLANATNLLDEQAILDPFCEPNLAPSTFWGFDFTPNMETAQERLGIDLGAFYELDILAIYDGGGIGELMMQTANSPNGPWTTIRTYPTISTNDWRYFTDLFTDNQPVRFLRFMASPDDMVQIGELFLCGTPSANNPNIPPGIVQDATVSDVSCNTVSLELVAPFDKDIVSYTVNYNGNSQIFNFTNREQTIVLADLSAGANYNFSILTNDSEGLTSSPFLINAATLPSADCQTNCNPSCPTQLCLKPSWIKDLTPQKPTDYFPTRLVDEQATAPICGNNSNPVIEWGFEFDPFDGLPPVMARLDLQAAYNLDSIYLYDGNAEGTFMVDYLDENGVWQPLVNYFTNAQDSWILFENPTEHARYLRLTKADVGANINEIVIHASPFINVDPPSGDITDFTPSTINCNEATLSWTLPTNSTINQLKLVVATTNNLEEINLSASTNSFTINNLSPNTVYECFLIVENNTNNPTELEIVTFQTPSNGTCTNNNPPNPVTNFQIIRTECESVMLSWQAPNDTDIAYYNVTVQPSNQDFSFTPLNEPIAFDIKNLQATTTYQFTIKVFDFDGNESIAQTISGTTQAANQCDDDDDDDDDDDENCDPNCPTFICVEPTWINDLTPTEHLDARRLFDEVALGNPVCGENGIPVSNWGEDYTPGLGPIIAEVDLQELYNLDAVYLFDIESDGNFKVEYQDANGNWVELFTYFTAPYNEWFKQDNLNISTQFLRFTKLNNSAKIGEVALFGLPVED